MLIFAGVRVLTMDSHLDSREVFVVTKGQKLCDNGFHAWEREIQVIDGEECVVRTCRRCGATEVCWCPRKPHSLKEIAALRE